MEAEGGVDAGPERLRTGALHRRDLDQAARQPCRDRQFGHLLPAAMILMPGVMGNLPATPI
jgi:hypothetical protein